MDWGNHHLGTTRMSADPNKGVVDADSKVHGVGNLFVAGSSVFPTYGVVEPDPEPGRPDAAAGRSPEKGDGMRRRDYRWQVVVAVGAAAAAGLYRFTDLFVKHYPPTPYDDVLAQAGGPRPCGAAGRSDAARGRKNSGGAAARHAGQQ